LRDHEVAPGLDGRDGVIDLVNGAKNNST